MGVFFYLYIYIDTIFFCLYFLLYLYTPCGSFFNFLPAPHTLPRGWVLHNTLLFFFCLRMNPTHKFRGIFFDSIFFWMKKITKTVRRNWFFFQFIFFVFDFVSTPLSYIVVYRYTITHALTLNSWTWTYLKKRIHAVSKLIFNSVHRHVL